MKRFTVTSGCNAYYLQDNVTQREGTLGDGCDKEENFRTLGTEAFRQAWEDEANEDVEEYFMAYFSDLYNLLIFDGGEKYMDRYTVVLEPTTRDTSLGAQYHSLSLSHNPDSPQGVSMYGECEPIYMAETMKQIYFLNLPLVVQKHIAKRLED